MFFFSKCEKCLFNEEKIPNLFATIVNKEGMSRLPKRMQQAKRVAPPAVPEIYRHSGSSFGSAGYVSCDEPATSMGGGSNNFYATASDPNNSLNVSLRSNSSSSSIDLPDSAPSRMLQSNAAANTSGMLISQLFIWSIRQAPYDYSSKFPFSKSRNIIRKCITITTSIHFSRAKSAAIDTQSSCILSSAACFTRRSRFVQPFFFGLHVVSLI